ncbi:MAG TPA: YetF domain-containing protein [Verrucomicrobiae bacterium]|nr:YetF domain-containing protein [Verrucomicrobiae bacterium]
MEQLLGLHAEGRDLTVINVCLRAVIVFMVTLVMARVADKRFLAKLSAFDVILGFLLASMMARAVNGSSSFGPTLVGGFVLVFLHRLFGTFAFHWDWFGRLVKGDSRIVIEQGHINRKALEKLHISEKDLIEEMHLNGNVDGVEEVRKATLERNGQISVIKEKHGS